MLDRQRCDLWSFFVAARYFCTACIASTSTAYVVPVCIMIETQECEYLRTEDVPPTASYEEIAHLTDQCEDNDGVLPTASFENLADLTVQSEDSEDSDGDEINTQLLLDAHAILVRNNHEYRPRADPGYAPLFCFHDYAKCECDNRELVLDIRNRLDACREDFKILMTEEWRIDSKLLYKTHLSLEMLENNLDMLADDMMS